MIKTSPILAIAISLSAFPSTVLAQQSGSIGPYTPLSEHADIIPEFNVGELHLQVDGWDIIPIYSIVENPDAPAGESPWKVRVRGIFFATEPVATKGADLRAVWYERPDDPTQEQWTASTWSTGSISVAEAAFSLMAKLSIPDIQNQLWALEDLEFVTLENPVPFTVRIVAGDTEAVLIDAPVVAEEIKECEQSEDEHYPLAGVPIEAGNIEKVQANLEHLAATFEIVITTRSWNSVGGRVIWPHHHERWRFPNLPG